VEFTREVFGHQFLHLELEELADTPLYVDLKLRALSGLRIVKGAVHGAKASRTGAVMSDGNDDLFLTMNLTGSYRIAHFGHDVVLEAGDAQISSCAEPSTYLRPQGTALGISIPRRALASRVKNLDDRVGSRIPRANYALSLVETYLGVLDEALLTPNLEQLAISHIYDLVALSIDGNVTADTDARRLSINAARCHAIKKYILANLTRPGFSIGHVAAWQRITPRQIQRVFEGEGVTFSEFLLDRRLAHAHQALQDRTRGRQSISEIVYASGFNDISSFNRAFRRRYSASPSEIRNRDVL
jgi:AraC-like DNA-binding protein